MDQSPRVSLHSTSHYFLEGLNEIGIEFLFSNLGTDHAPLIEEMARWRKHGLKHPPTILCPHENVAVHMAGGYAQVTGREKHLSSIYRKMQEKHLTFSEVLDIYGFRILVKDTPSIRRRWCGPTSSGNTTCTPAW